MDRADGLQQLKFLYDQVHQTAERVEHLPERMPFHVHPASLNYEKDLTGFHGQYNRLARQLQEEGLLSAEALAAEGLPLSFESDT